MHLSEQREATAASSQAPSSCAPAQHVASPTTLDQVLRARGPALRCLVADLTPVIEARVARALLQAERGHLQHELPDLVQDLLLMLFKDDARMLRRWTPELGVSLEAWVGLICDGRLRELVKRLQGRAASARLAAPGAGTLAHDPEPSIEARHELAHLRLLLRRAMSVRAVALFEALWLQEEDISSAAQRFSMTEGAVYAARARSLRLAREVFALA